MHALRNTDQVYTIQDASNSSQWVVPEHLIPRPQAEDSYHDSDLKFDCKYFFGHILTEPAAHNSRG